MLLPHEAAELQRRQARWPLHWCVAILSALVALSSPLLADVFVHGKIDHLLGRTDAVTATVDSVALDGECTGRSVRPRHRVLASWELDGQPGNGRYHVCENHDGENIPTEGQTVDLWIEDDGTVRDESPTATRVVRTSLGGMLFATVAVSSAGILIGNRRTRQRLLDEGGRPLGRAVPVEITVARRGVRMKPPLGAGPMIALGVIIHSLPGGGRVRRRSKLNGNWRLHLAPDDGRKHRIGLLVRDGGRCWVNLPANRFRPGGEPSKTWIVTGGVLIFLVLPIVAGILWVTLT